MNSDPTKNPPNSALVQLLERLTALVLGAVLLAIGWMVLASWEVSIIRVLPLQAEIIIVLVLLLTALALVSTVALAHTRR